MTTDDVAAKFLTLIELQFPYTGHVFQSPRFGIYTWTDNMQTASWLVLVSTVQMANSFQLRCKSSNTCHRHFQC